LLLLLLLLWSTVSLVMATNETAEVEQESPEELAFAEISAQLTVANLAVEKATEAFNLYRYQNTVPTPLVVARLAELRDVKERAERALQQLLPAYSEAKSRIHGWG
jgi:hypothetical protein